MSAQQNREQIKAYLKSQFNLPAAQIESMIPSFLSTLAGHLTALEEVYDSGDLEQVGKAGHTIKGALLNLGLHECAEIAFTIEQNGKAAETDADYQGLIKSLKDRLACYID